MFVFLLLRGSRHAWWAARNGFALLRAVSTVQVLAIPPLVLLLLLLPVLLFPRPADGPEEARGGRPRQTVSAPPRRLAATGSSHPEAPR